MPNSSSPERKMDIILPLKSISALEAWQVIWSFLETQKVSGDTVGRLENTRLSLKKIEATIKRRSLRHFGVSFEEVDVSFGSITGANHILILIDDRSAHQSIDWSKLPERFFAKHPFIQAWLSDGNYDAWQNQYDPFFYEKDGRPYDHFKLIPNGYSSPLDRMVLDISDNPGRRVIRRSKGFVEVIAAQMWVGEEFWRRAETDNGDILAKLPGRHEHLENGVTYLHFSDDLFTEKTDQEWIRELRNTLYPNSPGGFKYSPGYC